MGAYMKSRLLFLAILPLLAGCANYRLCPLKRLSLKSVPQHQDILFAAKTFNYSDCKIYLDRDVIGAGYTPIQLAIKNESERCLEFSIEEINLETVPTRVVAKSVYLSVWARALGYGIPGMFIICWPLLIPAVVDSIWAVEANKSLLKDYLDKSIPDKTIIPDSGLEGLIFVSNNNYQNLLEVKLVDKDSLEKIVCKSYL